VKPGALGEHPAGEDPLLLARELDLVHFDEGRGVRGLRRRARIANARRHLQRAELHRLIDGNLQMGDAAGDLVEGGEDGDRVLDGVGVTGRARQRQGAGRDGRYQRPADKSPPIHGNPSALRHAAPLMA
jgi:hypothetical protein